jgi:hypothetical protein
MGMLDKLMFWKKNDEFSFDDLANKELQRAGSIEPDNLGLDRKPLGLDEKSPFDDPFKSGTQDSTFPQQNSPFEDLNQRNQAPPPPQSGNRDLDLINSKLDTIRAMLQSMEHRLDRFERSNPSERKERLW